MTGKTIANMTKCKIITMNKKKISLRKIAKHFNTTHATVSRIINRYHECNTIENLPHPEKPSISNERNEHSLIRIVNVDFFHLKCWAASAQSIRRVLQKHNNSWQAASKKPRLSKKHQKARKNWCLALNDQKQFNKLMIAKF